MRRYKAKREYVWTADIAYLVGLIAADGCLINNGRHINVTSKDIEIIETVQSILNMNVKVPAKRSSYGGEAYHLQFSNVAFYDFLLAAQLTPAKSKTIGSVHIPDLFYRDFLRGVFDGDGTIYGYWDSRWKKSLMYYTSFASASRPFLRWMQATSTRLAGTAGVIKPGTRADNLQYAKTDSRRLFDFMYYRANLPRLSRKYHKFVAFLDSDPYANRDNARVL